MRQKAEFVFHFPNDFQGVNSFGIVNAYLKQLIK